MGFDDDFPPTFISGICDPSMAWKIQVWGSSWSFLPCRGSVYGRWRPGVRGRWGTTHPRFFLGFRWPVPNHLFCKIINDILNESKIQVEHSESYQMCKVLRKLSESCPWRTWHWFPWITRNSKALCQLPDPPNFHRSTTKRRSKRWWSLWMSLHLYHGTLPIYSKRFRKTPRKFYLCNHPLMRWHWKEQLHHVSTTWTGQVIWGRVNTMPGVPNGVPK